MVFLSNFLCTSILFQDLVSHRCRPMSEAVDDTPTNLIQVVTVEPDRKNAVLYVRRG
jgi:hypothetical protein